MKTESALNAVALEQRLAPAYFLENLTWKILSFKEQTQMRFVERGIVEQREEHIRGRMMQERGELVAYGDAGTLAILCSGLGHELTFRDLERSRQGVARELRRGFGNWPGELANANIWGNLAH